MPTPNTQELFRVVVTVPLGAPPSELAVAVAPIAPDPFVPDVSMFENVTTVIMESTACDSVAVTTALLSGTGANARQTSAVPACTFVRPTSAHVTPAPLTPVTVVFAPPR